MYTKEEASLLRQKFWTSFGGYMLPVPSANGEKVNWINYKTGIKGIFFKMDADYDGAKVAIEINNKNTVLQHQYFQIFNNFAEQFKTLAGNEWIWEKDKVNTNGQVVSCIYAEIMHVNIYRQTDWPEIISFLKKNILLLDVFWNEYQPAFETL